MQCSECRASAPAGDVPQPGWVGRAYQPGRGLLVILQNPGVTPANHADARDSRQQDLLRAFDNEPSIETHAALMDFMFADMGGEVDAPGLVTPGVRSGVRWRKWAHPVSKLIQDRTKLAWLNVVKVRTPGTHRKDAKVPMDLVSHGLGHLKSEIQILKPRAIVTLGDEARDAIASPSMPT